MRAAIRAHKNVLGLVGIDVRDVPPMQLVQKILELAEKAVGNRAFFGKRLSFDIFLDKASAANKCKEFGNVGCIAEFAIKQRFAPAETLAQPRKGNSAALL